MNSMTYFELERCIEKVNIAIYLPDLLAVLQGDSLSSKQSLEELIDELQIQQMIVLVTRLKIISRKI